MKVMRRALTRSTRLELAAAAVGAVAILVTLGSGTVFAEQITAPSTLSAVSQGQRLKVTVSGEAGASDLDTEVLFAFVIPPGVAPDCPQYADAEPTEADDLVASYDVGPGVFDVPLRSEALTKAGKWWFCAYLQDSTGNPAVPIATVMFDRSSPLP